MNLITYPNSFLRRKTKPVTEITIEIQNLISQMKHILYTSDAIGLAANQVGSEYRIFMSDINEELTTFINPSIELFGEDVICEEGCLSIPDINLNIKRKEKTFIKALDENGKEFELETDGLLSNVIQHEYDHLENILIIDRIPNFKLQNVLKRYDKKTFFSRY